MIYFYPNTLKKSTKGRSDLGHSVVLKDKRTKAGIIFIGLQTVGSDGRDDFQIVVIDDTYTDIFKRVKAIRDNQHARRAVM